MFSRQQGLTLLELLVALVIISLLASVGIPNFSQWNCARSQRYEFDQFAGLLYALRGEALSSGRSFQVSVTQNTTTLEVRMSDDPVLCNSDQNWTDLDDSMNIVLPELSKLNFHNDSVTCFFPNDFDGYASSSSIEFSRDACGGNAADLFSSYKLQVLSATGLLRRFKRQSDNADWLSL